MKLLRNHDTKKTLEGFHIKKRWKGFGREKKRGVSNWKLCYIQLGGFKWKKRGETREEGVA